MTLYDLSVSGWETHYMDMQENWNQRNTILDGIASALSYIEGQVDDLRTIVEQEVEKADLEHVEWR